MMKKIALLFPGQGSQYVGMGRSLYEEFEVARHTFEEASDVLSLDMQKLCFEGCSEELTQTANAQPAILTVSVAAYRVYMSEIGLQPYALVGHSLGEFTALTCAGVMRYADALKIVRRRGQLMQEAVEIGEGAMLAVKGIDYSQVEQVIHELNIEIACYNAGNQIVLTGYAKNMQEAKAKLSKWGADLSPLKVSAPFHSSLMKPAADRLREELISYTYDEFNGLVLSNVTAQPYQTTSEMIELLTLQMIKPVRWRETMQYLLKQGIQNLIEIGPKKVLTNLAKQNSAFFQPMAIESKQTLELVKERVNNWDRSTSNFIEKCIAIIVCTKNKQTDAAIYEKGVVEPFRRLQEMHQQLEQENRLPTLEQMREALRITQTALKTKKVLESEQSERIRELLEETKTGHLFSEIQLSR